MLIVDYKIYNSESKIEDFASDYSEYVGDIKIYYVIGDSIIEAYKYDGALKNTSGISVTNDTSTISLEIEGSNYNFDLKKGKNFYFVLSKNIGSEKHILRGWNGKKNT